MSSGWKKETGRKRFFLSNGARTSENNCFTHGARSRSFLAYALGGELQVFCDRKIHSRPRQDSPGKGSLQDHLTAVRTWARIKLLKLLHLWSVSAQKCCHGPVSKALLFILPISSCWRTTSKSNVDAARWMICCKAAKSIRGSSRGTSRAWNICPGPCRTKFHAHKPTWNLKGLVLVVFLTLLPALRWHLECPQPMVLQASTCEPPLCEPRLKTKWAYCA